MSRIRCKVGIHNYEPNDEERRVECRHCGSVDPEMTWTILDREEHDA